MASICVFVPVTGHVLQPATEGRTNYTSDNHLTYSGSYFYYDGIICGENCDIYGRNCKKGICDVSGCSIANGYSVFMIKKINNSSHLVCYNPNTEMAYSAYSNYNIVSFYLDSVVCGQDCDYDGTNCRSGGLCSFATCNQNEGFTEFIRQDKTYLCYNPSKKLGYWITYFKGRKQFFYDGKRCGLNCDYNGKNCEYESGSSPMVGICNPEDCPQGYYVQQGYCRKQGSDKLLYKDKDGKFKSASVRDFKYGVQMTTGAAGYFVQGVFGAIFK